MGILIAIGFSLLLTVLFQIIVVVPQTKKYKSYYGVWKTVFAFIISVLSTSLCAYFTYNIFINIATYVNKISNNIIDTIFLAISSITLLSLIPYFFAITFFRFCNKSRKAVVIGNVFMTIINVYFLILAIVYFVDGNYIFGIAAGISILVGFNANSMYKGMLTNEIEREYAPSNETADKPEEKSPPSVTKRPKSFYVSIALGVTCLFLIIGWATTSYINAASNAASQQNVGDIIQKYEQYASQVAVSTKTGFTYHKLSCEEVKGKRLIVDWVYNYKKSRLKPCPDCYGKSE